MGKRPLQGLSKPSLLDGVITLGGAAVISKLLGTLQKIPLQNIGGDGVFGIYNTVYPYFILMLFLATAGIPIAVSKLVSESMVHERWTDAQDILKTSAVILSLSGLFILVVLFMGAHVIAGWIDNQQIVWALQSVSAALLFVPFMAVLRGYFQGQQQMLPTAVSQMVEQLIRVATMIILLLWLTKQGFSNAIIAAGATFGSVTGALAGFMVMVFFWFRFRKGSPIRSIKGRFQWKWAKRLLMIAVPVCLGAIVLPVLNIVDTFTLPRLIKQAGGSEAYAMGLFGIYSRGLPLVQLVAMLFSSVSVVLVPFIAEAKVKKQYRTIEQQASFSLQLTWYIGLASSFGLAVTAVPINIMMFMDDQGSTTMAILAFVTMFSIVNIVSGSILQGLGYYKAPALHLLYAAALKVLLNIWWVPLYGIEGAAAAAVAAFALAALLNMWVLSRALHFQIHLKKLLFQPFVVIFCMVAAVYMWLMLLDLLGLQLSIGDSRIWNSFVALSAVTIGAYIFMAALLYFKMLTPTDFQPFPSLYHKVAPWLMRLGFWKKETERKD